MFIRQNPSNASNETSIAEASSSQVTTSDPVTFATTEIINPEYEAWLVVDQLLLGWLYNSITPEIATQLMGFERSKDLWDAIQELFGVQSRAEEDYLRQTFQQTRKGNNTMSEYLRLMKMHSNNLGQAGSPGPSKALISQVLLGLDENYNAIVATLQRKPDISWL